MRFTFIALVVFVGCSKRGTEEHYRENASDYDVAADVTELVQWYGDLPGKISIKGHDDGPVVTKAGSVVTFRGVLPGSNYTRLRVQFEKMIDGARKEDGSPMTASAGSKVIKQLSGKSWELNYEIPPVLGPCVVCLIATDTEGNKVPIAIRELEITE